jgi:hypothetical protein
MAKDKNTYAKRQRETQKRQKAEAKRDRRRKRKERTDDTSYAERNENAQLVGEP